MTAEDIPLNKRDFERALQALLKDAKSSKDNPGSYKSEACTRCFDCMFTTSSVDCFSCTYCSNCNQCSDCTHTHDCSNVHGSSYCVSSNNCYKSSYLLQCSNCYECLFCFGCVGLVKKEFHILNHPFPRKTYFQLVKQLKEAFGIG